MARLIATSDRAEVDRLRDALDARGFAEGEDEYVVLVTETGDPAELPSLDQRHTSRLLVVAYARGRALAGAWSLLAHGADDVLPWSGPDTADEVLVRLERWRKIDRLLAEPPEEGLVLGSSPALRRALVDLLQLALFGTGPILLVGETGTGKEVAARLVHAVTRRAAQALVVVDCTTIVPSLSGSELFGHEKGAFTGADRARAGAFAAADGGTLFLDEIGELPLGLQAELLRVLQEGTYKRVGGDAWSRTRFRLVSATNRDLDTEQREGRFRSDLYHRIASGVVRLPPLRQREEDLELLFRHFLAEAAGRDLEVAPPVLALLHERSFPGNLRELRQLAYAVAARHAGPGVVTPGDVPPSHRPDPGEAEPFVPAQGAVRRAVRACLAAGLTLADVKSLVGDLAVEEALDDCGGNVHEAAQLLGVTDRAIQLRRRAPRR